MSQIPQLELDALIVACTEAADEAQRGDLAAGYEILLNGFDNVRVVAQDGEPWAAELRARWNRALDEYARRWGVARG